MLSEFVTATIEYARNERTKEMVAELGEVAWDSFVSEGILRDIPFFGSILKACQASEVVRASLFKAKIRAFLSELDRMSFEEREMLTKTLEDNESEIRRTGETVVLVLDQLDHVDKAYIIGRLFRAYLAGQIDRDTMFRVCPKVLRCSYPDLEALRSTGFGESPHVSVCMDLANVGLMKIKSGGDAPFWSPGSDKEDYELSPHGMLLVGILSDTEAMAQEAGEKSGS